ncbi:MAG TPA: protein phosphatase [Janthinobacterium sp.]|nr:protein phosphatase [Janthinobacterium sp.]
MTSLIHTLDFGPGLDVAAHSCASASALQTPENQDNFVLIDGKGRAVFMRDQCQRTVHLPDWPPGHARIAVLDGMGGHGNGRQAAEAVAEGLLRILACANLDELNGRLDALHDSLQAHFVQPDESGTARRPGTTLTLLELRPNQAPMLYHAGDSRLYEITSERARPLTVDHVPATTFAMRGLLNEREWQQQVHGEHRAQISQAFILGNAISDPHVLSGPLFPLNGDNLPFFLRALGDRRALEVRSDALYLLATDGFWACAKPADWVAQWPALLAGLGAAAAIDRLFSIFMKTPPPGLHIDNLTAIALRFTPSTVDETALPDAAEFPVF